MGTALRRRLEKDNVLFPLSVMPWRYHDGNWATFMPKNMTLQEFQDTPIQIMNWFYSRLSFVRLFLRAVALPAYVLLRRWKEWRVGWHRDVVKAAGSILVRKWRGKKDSEKLTVALQEYWDRKSGEESW